MTTFFQQVFSRSLSQTGKAPSFNDFSLHVAADSTLPLLCACVLYRTSTHCTPTTLPENTFWEPSAESVAPGRTPGTLHLTAVDFAAENDLDSDAHDFQPAAAPENVRPKRTNVWQDTFSPQMNSNMKRLPASYYDAPSTDKQATTVWEEIIKAETIKKGFDYFDNNRKRPSPFSPF